MNAARKKLSYLEALLKDQTSSSDSDARKIFHSPSFDATNAARKKLSYLEALLKDQSSSDSDASSVEEKTDLISDLPPPILHHILSYLSIEDSVRTSVLSKQWNSVQKLFPVLEFKPPINFWKYSPRFKDKKCRREYLDFVDRSLQNFADNQLCIERLDLCLKPVDRDSVPLVNSWLPLALHNGVSDLRFDVNVGISYDYPLPETTFTLNSSLLRGSSEFFLVKKLELSCVRLSEKIVQDIIRNCPNLIDLNLSDFYGLETLNIYKPEKLATLTIIAQYHWGKLTSVFVDALSLQCFTLDMYYEDDTPHEIDLTSCCNLREFDIRTSAITDAQFNLNISRFPLLEVLKIESCFDLRRIRISLQRLKLLDLNCHYIEAIELDAPVLSEFFCSVISQRTQELPVLVLADAISCSMYLRYEICEIVGEVMDSFWFLRIREYLNVPFKSINLDLNPNDYSNNHCVIRFDPYKLRERVIPPLVKVDRLDLIHLTQRDPSHWETLLDGLLWSCHPKTVCVTVNSTLAYDCVQTLCRMLNQTECQLCCNLSRCECWRCRFRAATTESTGDIEFDATNVGSVTEILFSKYPRRRVPSLFSYSKRMTFVITFRLDWET